MKPDTLHQLQGMLEPIAERRVYAHKEHDQQREDPYHWLRDRDDPAVSAYLAAENAYADAWFASGPDLREQLYQEMVARVVRDEDTVPQFEDGYWWYRRWVGSSEHGVLCRRRGTLDAREEIYLDIDKVAQGSDCFLLGGIAATRDGKLIAYAADRGGDRRFEIRIRDATTGADGIDVLVDSDGSGLEWSPCHRYLFYVALDPETLRSERVMRHQVGTPQAHDVEVFREQDETFDVGLGESRSREWLLITSGQTLSDEWLGLRWDELDSAPQLLIQRERGHECELEHYDGQWFLRTNRSAINFQLLRCLDDDQWDWQELIGHNRDLLLEEFLVCSAGVAVQQRGGGGVHVRMHSWDGKRDQQLHFAQACHTTWIGSNPDSSSAWLRIGYASLTEAASVIDVSWESGERRLQKQYAVAGDYRATDYATERLFAAAPDGEQVPISLVYRRDRREPCGNPVLLYGYGAYGETIDPFLDLAVVSLLDRGVVYAIAHVRGSQAKGRPWYEAGRHHHKENSFTDFIACAETLIQTGWADPQRLACEGHSAGGLLVGAVLNQRPDLFAVAIAGVPFVDCLSTMLDASIPLTTSEYDEWGDPNDPADYQRMAGWSPYDQVKPQKWPALCVIAGYHDTQIHYWEPAKWVAKIRATANSDSDPLILVTDMDSGHLGITGRFGRYRDAARNYTFLLRILDLG